MTRVIIIKAPETVIVKFDVEGKTIKKTANRMDWLALNLRLFSVRRMTPQMATLIIKSSMLKVEAKLQIIIKTRIAFSHTALPGIILSTGQPTTLYFIKLEVSSVLHCSVSHT